MITESAVVFVVILGMTLVTYLPRLWPFLLLKKVSLPPRFALFLRLIPYSALGALIMPGVIFSVPGRP